MEFHSEALNCLCRLCGGPLSKYSHNKLDLGRKIEKVLGIDVRSDKKFVHPPRLCDKCRRLLQKYYKEIQTHKRVKTNSFPDISWVPHSEDCKVCESHGHQSSQDKGSTSTLFLTQEQTGGRTLGLRRSAQPGAPESDSASFISKCSDMFLKYGYMSTGCQDGVILSYVKANPGAEKIHSFVKIFEDKTFSVTILGRQIENELIVAETKVSSPDTLIKILDFLHTRNICKGMTGFSDLHSTDVFEQNEDSVAYVDSGFGTETTIRHKDCQLFLQEGCVGGMCTQCSIYKSNLFRQRKRKSESSDTGANSKRPNISMSRTELLQKLESVTRENKALKRKLDMTKQMLSDEIEKNRILLDEKKSNGFLFVE